MTWKKSTKMYEVFGNSDILIIPITEISFPFLGPVFPQQINLPLI